MEDYISRTLTVFDKDSLFDFLLKKDGVVERIREIKTNLNKYFSRLLWDYFIDDELKIVSIKAKRLVISQDVICINGETLQMADKGNLFPNSIITIPDYNPKKNIKVHTALALEIDKYVPKIGIGSSSKSIKLIDLNKIPKDKLDLFKEMYLDYLKLQYYKDNFLIEYFPNKAHYINNRYYCGAIHFLGNKTTWGQVKKINKDWYDYLIELNKSNSDTDFNKKLSKEEELAELKRELGF